MFVEITDQTKIEQLEEAGLLWYDCKPYNPDDDYPIPWEQGCALYYLNRRPEWGYKFFILVED